MRVLFTMLACGCLVLALVAAAADQLALRLTLDRMALRGTDALFSFEGLSLDLPVRMTAHGVSLKDPGTGLPVAFSEFLVAELDWQLTEDPPARITLVRGRGCRLMLSRDRHGFGLERAIKALFSVFRRSRAPGAPRMPAPPQLYEDVDIVIAARGMVLEEFPSCRIHIHDEGDAVRIEALLGNGNGHITATVDETGLRSMDVIDVKVTPGVAALIPGDEHELAHRLRPSGRLDMELRLDKHGRFLAKGTLREATLRPRRIPLLLTNANLPFTIQGGHLTVEQADLDFEGGSMHVSLDWTPDTLDASVEVRDADFRQVFPTLLSDPAALSWFEFEDGGNVELSLDITQRPGMSHPVTRGNGGFLMDRVHVGINEVVFDVEDVVGSFTIDGPTLVFGTAAPGDRGPDQAPSESRAWTREVTGRCASGALGFAGTLDMETGEADMDVWVSGINLGQVRLEPSPERSHTHQRLHGWLHGWARYRNRTGAAGGHSGRGFLGIHGADLSSIPVADDVLRAVEPEPEQAQGRDSLEMDFRIDGRTLRITRNGLKLTSGALTMMGDGKVRLDGELDITLVPISVRSGPLGGLLRYIERNVLRVDVEGTLEDPQVTVKPFEGITHPFGQFMGYLRRLFGVDDQGPDRP